MWATIPLTTQHCSPSVLGLRSSVTLVSSHNTALTLLSSCIFMQILILSCWSGDVGFDALLCGCIFLLIMHILFLATCELSCSILQVFTTDLHHTHSTGRTVAMAFNSSVANGCRSFRQFQTWQGGSTALTKAGTAPSEGRLAEIALSAPEQGLPQSMAPGLSPLVGQPPSALELLAYHNVLLQVCA